VAARTRIAITMSSLTIRLVMANSAQVKANVVPIDAVGYLLATGGDSTAGLGPLYVAAATFIGSGTDWVAGEDC